MMEEQEINITISDSSHFERSREVNFKKFAWRQFKKNKPAYYSYKILIFLASKKTTKTKTTQ